MLSLRHLPHAIVTSLLVTAGALGCAGRSEVVGPAPTNTQTGAGGTTTVVGSTGLGGSSATQMGPFSAITEAAFACMSPIVGESSAKPPTLLGKFGAEFTGVSFGPGTSPASTLRKKVPVAFAQSTPAFSLGDAWLMRPSAQSEDFFYYTIRLTYLGNESRCYAKLDPLRFIDANGQILVTDLVYLDNVSKSAGSLKCISKGDAIEAVSLATSSSIPIYSNIAAIEIGAIDPGSAGISNVVKASVAPTDLCKTQQGFVVSLLNRGAQAARVADLHRYLLSDGEGPVGFGFLHRLLPLSQSTAVKPNERSILSDEYILSDGRADKLLILTDYEDASGSASFNIDSPPQASFSTANDAALHIRRQAAQDLKQEKFKLWSEHLGLAQPSR